MMKSGPLPSGEIVRSGAATFLLRFFGTQYLVGAISMLISVLWSSLTMALDDIASQHARRCAKARSLCDDLKISQRL